MLRVILIDDEPLARQGMRNLLATFPDINIVAEADNVRTGAEAVRHEKPDVIFLDVRMPGHDGFELLRQIEPIPKIVFVTAHAEHAVRAFEVDAVDYLLKPVRHARLAATIQRLHVALDSTGETNDTKPECYGRNDRICLRTPERTVIAPLERISVFSAEGDYTQVFVEGEPSLLIGQTLSHFEQIVPNPPFVRLGRSLIVNMERILKAERASRDETKLYVQGAPAPFILGRTLAARLKQVLSPTPIPMPGSPD